MKTSSLLAALAAGTCLVPWLFTEAPGQQQPSGGLQPGPANIAVVDTNFIMKNHNRFKEMMAQLQADVQAAEEAAKKERDAVRQMAERLDQYHSGSPDYKRVEEDIAKRQSDLSVRVQLQKKEFLQREARICHMVYTEIMQEVEYFAANNGVALVVRVNTDRVDVQKPDEVLRDISKPIVWFPPGCNITNYILDRVNRNAMNAGASRDARPGVPLR